MAGTLPFYQLRKNYHSQLCKVLKMLKQFMEENLSSELLRLLKPQILKWIHKNASSLAPVSSQNGLGTEVGPEEGVPHRRRRRRRHRRCRRRLRRLPRARSLVGRVRVRAQVVLHRGGRGRGRRRARRRGGREDGGGGEHAPLPLLAVTLNEGLGMVHVLLIYYPSKGRPIWIKTGNVTFDSTVISEKRFTRFLSIALACCASLPFWLAGGICNMCNEWRDRNLVNLFWT